jgi:hypothetical protein
MISDNDVAISCITFISNKHLTEFHLEIEENDDVKILGSISKIDGGEYFYTIRILAPSDTASYLKIKYDYT